jgi:hypothetical protein
MQHESTALNSISIPDDDRHVLGSGHGYDDTHTLLSPSDATFFPAAEEMDMDLDFFVADFCRHSHMPAISGSLSSHLPSVAPPLDPMLPAPQTGSMSNNALSSAANDENNSPRHPPTFLETISHLSFKTPSVAQSPISDILRLARQGLQAVHLCLPNVLPPVLEGSPDLARPANLDSIILACILLMEQVLLCYESLPQRRPPAVAPPAPSAIPNACASPSSSCRVQPIFIGNFEVKDTASRQLILDAVIMAEKQEARNAVSKLEEWARELAEQGKTEGLLATAFLEPLKRRFRDSPG